MIDCILHAFKNCSIMCFFVVVSEMMSPFYYIFYYLVAFTHSYFSADSVRSAESPRRRTKKKDITSISTFGFFLHRTVKKTKAKMFSCFVQVLCRVSTSTYMHPNRFSGCFFLFHFLTFFGANIFFRW